MAENLIKLDSLVNFSEFSEHFEIIGDAVTGIIPKIFVSDLNTDVSPFKEHRHYSFKLVSFKKLGFDIPGTEMAIVLNPAVANGSRSEFAATYTFHWEILKYVQTFNLASFDFSPRSFFDLLLNILEVDSKTALLNYIEETFPWTDDDHSDGGTPPPTPDTRSPIEKFIADFNTKNTPTTDLVYPSGSNVDPIEDLVLQMNSNGNSFDVAEIIFEDIIENNAASSSMKNIEYFFSRLSGDFSIDNFTKILKPSFAASFEDITIALQFPRKWLKPVDPVTLEVIEDEDIKSALTYDVGSLNFSTEEGFEFIDADTFNLSPSQIGNTGLIVSVSQLKFDFRADSNIPEATLDGRPDSFKGIFAEKIGITLPKKWFNNVNNTTLQVAGHNVLIGTGGLSGTIALETVGGTPNVNNDYLPVKIGNFEVGFNRFDMTFKQNAIIGSNIEGLLKIPKLKDGAGNDAEIIVKASFDENGGFYVSGNEPQGIDINIPNVLTIRVYTLDLGNKGGKFYVRIKGALKITADPAGTGSPLMKDFVDVPGITIWEDGSIEIEGGRIPLPRAFELPIGPVTVSITAIEYGTANRRGRKYSYFGFSGGLDMSPGGVDVQGDGIKYFYTTEGTFDHFLELEQIAVDIHLPSHMDPKEAKINVHGFLSISNPEDNSSAANSDSGNPSKEYMGSIKFLIRQDKIQFGGGASMRMRPKVPAFLVDAFLEFNNGIPVGSTGLGLYGFKGLFGQRYLPSKTAAGLSEDASWWQFYKQPEVGVGFQKYEQKPGLSIGAGVVLGTQPDSGYAFSSKLMLILGLPDVFLLVGQAGVLQKRLSFFDEKDPPYYAMFALSKESVNVGAGAVYKIPSAGTQAGKVLVMYPEIEMAYFFNNPKAWFINFGEEFPAQERIKARILDLFDGYAFLMINSKRIRVGAGASYVFNKKYGPIRVQASAYLDSFAEIAFEPLQIGGAIALRAAIRLKISKFGLSLEAGAGVAAEAPEPFIITGYIYVSVKFPWPIKRKKFNIDFTWRRNNHRNNAPLPAIKLPATTSSEAVPANAVNIQTGETFPITYLVNTASSSISSPSSSAWVGGFSNAVVPLDSFIDIQFERGVNPDVAITNIGGHSFSSENTSVVPPRKGVSAQVNHRFTVKKVDIKIWDPTGAGSWKDYKVYDACTPIKRIIDEENPSLPNKQARIDAMRDGYWQITDGKKINKLRLACDNIFSYTTQASEGSYEIETFDVGGETIFCGAVARIEQCIDWLSEAIDTNYTSGVFYSFQDLRLKFGGIGGKVKAISAHQLTQGIKFTGPSSLLLYFNKPVVEVKLKLETTADNVQINYFDDQDTSILIKDETPASLASSIDYDDTATPVSKVKITYDGGGTGSVDTTELTFGKRSDGRWGGGGWLEGQMADVILCDEAISPIDISNYNSANVTPPPNMVGRWPLNGATADDTVNGNTGTINGATLQVMGGRSCYDFNGNEDVTVPHTSNIALLGGNFTMMCWMRSNTTVDLDILIDKRGDSGFHLFIDRGRIGYQILNESKYTNRLSATTVADGNWHHVAVTHKATNGETIIFVDGVQKETYIEKRVVFNTGHLHLLECCYFTEEDHIFNTSNPIQSKVQSDIDAMTDAMTIAYQPIWRPYSKFAVQIHAEDIVDGSVNNFHFNFGFQTEGPVGHFPIDTHPNYTRLPEKGRDKQVAIANLKHYIDYQHSYPNPSGKLVGEKPLYRKDIRLKLFFIQPYINSMFSNWDAYKGNSKVDSKLVSVVYDPEIQDNEGISLDPELVVNSFDYERSDQQIFKNFDKNGLPCSVTIPPLTSQNISGEYVIELLKANKLYTAVFSAVVNPTPSDPTKEVTEEVHRYGFLTSRYLNFAEHIDSYILDASAGVDGKAIYKKAITVSAADHTLAKNVFTDNLANTHSLISIYADSYDRLIDGVLKIQELNGIENVEVNLLHDSSLGLIGLLIRSPEPIWDPKMPLSQSTPPLNVSDSNGNTNYSVIYSKDRSSAFVSNPLMNISTGILTIKLQHYDVGLNVDGVFEYSPITADEKTITIDLTNYI